VDDLSFNGCFLAVPGDPQGVIAKVLNSTTIIVQWQPPQEKDRHGVIRGYHVHVQEAKEEVRIVNSTIVPVHEKLEGFIFQYLHM
jgi:dTDP-4-dehydrorhamnose 3,5-epimerase-like enzyme